MATVIVIVLVVASATLTALVNRLGQMQHTYVDIAASAAAAIIPATIYYFLGQWPPGKYIVIALSIAIAIILARRARLCETKVDIALFVAEIVVFAAFIAMSTWSVTSWPAFALAYVAAASAAIIGRSEIA